MSEDFNMFWNSLNPLWQANIKHGLGNEYSLKGKVPTTFSELDKLKSISVSHNELSILHYFKNLKKLDAFKIDITDYKQISELATLKELNITNSSLNDLSFILSLQSLTKLNISRTDVNSIEPLVNLPKLSFLNVSYTSIENWEPLQRCKKLKTLYAVSCSGFSPHDIGQLNNLKVLDIRNNKLSSFDFLATLQKLECIWFENVERGNYAPSCESGDLTILKKLPKLKQIGCSPEEFEEIKFWFPQTMHFDVRGKEYVVENHHQFTLVEYNAYKRTK